MTDRTIDPEKVRGARERRARLVAAALYQWASTPYGICPRCGHDWREHPGGDLHDPLVDGRGECREEVDQRRRPAAQRCRQPAP